MRIFHTNKPHIVITMGDLAGIGPEVLVKALERVNNYDDVCVVIIGDIETLKEFYVGTDNLPLLIHSPDKEVHLRQNVLNVIDPGPSIDRVIPGLPVENSDRKSLNFLDLATKSNEDIKFYMFISGYNGDFLFFTGMDIINSKIKLEEIDYVLVSDGTYLDNSYCDFCEEIKKKVVMSSNFSIIWQQNTYNKTYFRPQGYKLYKKI